MFKVTPNPPDTNPIPYDATLDVLNIKTAQDRAVDLYLNPAASKTATSSRKPGSIFLVDPRVDNETLLVEACDSLSSASDMVRDIAASVDDSQRRAVLVLQQVIMLSELAVNRVLDTQRVPR